MLGKLFILIIFLFFAATSLPTQPLIGLGIIFTLVFFLPTLATINYVALRPVVTFSLITLACLAAYMAYIFVIPPVWIESYFIEFWKFSIAIVSVTATFIIFAAGNFPISMSNIYK